MRRLGTTMLVMVGLALVACGTESASGLGASASSQLSPKVEAVQAAIAGGDSAGAARSLAEIRQLVAGLLLSEELTDDQASEVLAAVADVEARLAPMPTTQVPPPATTSVPAESDGDGDADDRGQGKKKEGKGNDDDD